MEKRECASRSLSLQGFSVYLLEHASVEARSRWMGECAFSTSCRLSGNVDKLDLEVVLAKMFSLWRDDVNALEIRRWSV
jgi:hypothetical protein